MFLKVSLLFLSLVLCSRGRKLPRAVPDWHYDTRCGDQKKYFFSNETKKWEDAHGWCLKLDGYLLELDDREEQNCLLKYAKKKFNTTESIHDGWYWHSGKDM